MHRLSTLTTATFSLLLLLVASFISIPVAAKEVKVNIYRAKIGPVYQRLADGRVISVTIYVTYPDKLVPQGPGRGLGTVNFTVETNWTGLWNGILTVMVVDPGYRVDNTTFKPVNSDNAWADGGAILGSGNIHVAGSEAVKGPRAAASAVLWPHVRYVEAKPGSYEAQYFFKARLALFDKGGEKVLGGDILVYTTSDTAPHVVIVKPESGDGGGHAVNEWFLYSLGVAAAALAAYFVGYYIFSRMRSS